MGCATLLKEMRKLPKRYRDDREAGILGAPLELHDLPADITDAGQCEAVTRRTRRFDCEALSPGDRRPLALPPGRLDAIRPELRNERAGLVKPLEGTKARARWSG